MPVLASFVHTGSAITAPMNDGSPGLPRSTQSMASTLSTLVSMP
jgi:hypothetical protein